MKVNRPTVSHKLYRRMKYLVSEKSSVASRMDEARKAIKEQKRSPTFASSVGRLSVEHVIWGSMKEFIVEISPTGASSVESPIRKELGVCWRIEELIVERNLLLASSVGSRLPQQDNCGCMKEFIVERNLIHASNVGSHLLKQEICVGMKELIVERNLIHASSVGGRLPKQEICISMKELIVERDPIHASSVGSHFHE